MAKQLGVSKDWLQSEAEAGRVPCLNAGGKLLFHQHVVIKVIEELASKTPQESHSHSSKEADQ